MFPCLKKSPLPESCPLSDPELTTRLCSAISAFPPVQPSALWTLFPGRSPRTPEAKPQSLALLPAQPFSSLFSSRFHLHQLLWSVISVPEKIFQILILKSQFLLPLRVCHGALAWPQLSSNLSCLPSARRSTALLSSLFPRKASP